MKMIDFMTKTEYMPSNQEKQDIKMALILPDGTILLADKSHDDKPMRNYGVTGPRKTVEVHVDYVRILCEHFFRDDQELLEYANQENFYAVIMHWIQQGIVLFNNSTTYEGPTFILHGKHGQLLIPDDIITEEQIESLSSLQPFIDYFRDIEVKKFTTQEPNIHAATEFCSGNEAIPTYLKEKVGHAKTS